MPARLLISLGFVLFSFGAATEVSANWFTDIFKGIVKDTKSRNCWPDQYLDADRSAVQQPFCTMVNNGWRKQNLLGEFHFQQGTGQLNEAGRNKVRWILTACPEQHRSVYVHIGGTEEETKARRAAVEQLVAQLASENPAPVMVTSISDEGWSADQADMIGRKYMSSTPDPRLPQISGQSGGGSSSGGN